MYKFSEEDSALKRYIALKAIRENMYLAKPNTLNIADTIEDIPGPLRNVSPFFNDVLPSAAIISTDPEKRKQQISAAVAKIKSAKNSHGDLARQLARTSLSVGLGSVPVSFGMSVLFKLLGARSPIRNGAIRSPFNVSRQIGKFRSSELFRKAVLETAKKDAITGAGLGVAAGAGFPLLAHTTDLRDRDLSDAADILQKNPYGTSLPVADIVRTMNYKDDPRSSSLLRDTMAGAGIGAASGTLGAYTSALVHTPVESVRAVLEKRLPNISKLYTRIPKSTVGTSAALMGALGAAAGIYANRMRRNDT